MNKLIILSFCMLFVMPALGQTKKTVYPASNESLPDIRSSIVAQQTAATLFIENLGNNSKEHDVNSIILDIEKYIDSLHGTRSRADYLLNKYFAPLRLFFLTTTNKTTVATAFLYTDVPYQFCRYNDTALALQLGAVKDGNIYNLGKMTERRIAKTAMETCLLPSLKALDEFKDAEIKYAGISIYYGCKDTREGAGPELITPYCMTLVARLSDIQQYNAGLITAKGLLSVADVYLSNLDDAHDLRKMPVPVD